MKHLVTLVGLIAFLMVVLPGPLYKFNIVELGTAFAGFRLGVYVGGAALALLLVQVLFMRKTVSLTSAVITVIFAAVAIVMPINMMNTAKSIPPIHDISTDLINPPKFVAVVPLRADAPNPVAYAGEVTTAQQREAYPELKPLEYNQTQTELVAAITKAMENLGWELVNSDVNNGIVEATDTTTWFGFKDDVVVRINDKGSKRVVEYVVNHALVKVI